MNDTRETRPSVSALDHIFTYHPPRPGQQERYEKLRQAAKQFAEAIITLTPASADQSAAIRKVREAVMTANAAIALELPDDDPTPAPTL